MDVKIRFRVNKITGEVEVFEIEDQGSNLSIAEHNARHDRIAAEIGNVIERNAQVIEVLPGTVHLPTRSSRQAEEGEQERVAGEAAREREP